LNVFKDVLQQRTRSGAPKRAALAAYSLTVIVVSFRTSAVKTTIYGLLRDHTNILPPNMWHNVAGDLKMSAAHAQIGEWLGVDKTSDESDLLDVVENRFAPAVIKRLHQLGFERSELDKVVIASRTLQHRRSRHAKLSVEESDRVLRLARVLSKAEATYGTRERALAWLRKPITRLNNRSPLSLLTTDTGARIVEDTLTQIDEGMFA
jgi:putative toxin-antitoxin system antitoxin component (TIGR02293 family)